MADETADWVAVLLALYDSEIVVEGRYVSDLRGGVGSDVGMRRGVIKSDTISEEDMDVPPELSRPVSDIAEDINYLNKIGLVDFPQESYVDNPVTYRLTDDGFRIAHELRTTRERSDWRTRSQRTNGLLAAATVVLAINAGAELLGGVSFPLRPVSAGALLAVGTAVGAVLGRLSD